MIRNFITVAVRNFLRQKFYSFINIIGLASGLICCLFIYLWVEDEVNKNRFHRDSEKIFRVVSNLKLSNGETLTWDITPGPLAEDLRENSPEVEMAVRTMDQGAELLRYQDKSFMERGYYADPDFFRLFSFEIIAGKPVMDSTSVSHISISSRLAKKLFGSDNDAVGKTIRVNDKNDYIVAAVFSDVSRHSSFRFDYILPFEVFKKRRGEGFTWGNYDHPLYVKLIDPAQAGEAVKKLNERRAIAMGGKDSENMDFYFQPFTEFYLHGQFENGVPAGGRIQYVRIFSIVAVFILVIACINFMNMATAKAATRSKEVGIRKVVGAQRKSLILQFISESILISGLAMIMAIGFVHLTLPMFNMLVGKQMVIEFTQPDFLIAVALITLTTGLLAGCYPAIFLSSYQPVQVLKGALTSGVRGGSLRKGLVVFQFTLTVILIASSLVIYNQIRFIMSKNLGYEKGTVLSFSGSGAFRPAYETFKNEALQSPAIQSISRSNESLVQVNNQNSSVIWPGKPEDDEQFFRTVVVDYDFLETMGLTLEEGRFFNRQFNDTNNVVLTRRAVEVMGLADPVGQTISQWGVNGKVVGVVNDIHSRSMYETIDPVLFLCNPEWTWRVFVRFDAIRTEEAVSHVESIYRKYSGDFPFNYTFLEDDFEKLYNNEKVTASLALGFTVMAVIISGLGLLGLAAYTAERRRKEISIRKTLGASVSGLVSMMSKEFVLLSFVAIVIGCPAAYLMSQKFLANYAYHTELSWEIFLLTSILILAVALLTVIFQVARAAMANPVDALRNE